MNENSDPETTADVVEFVGKTLWFGGFWAVFMWISGSGTGWSLVAGAMVFGAFFGAHGVWTSRRIRRKFGSIAAKNEYDRSRRSNELPKNPGVTEAGIAWDRWKLSGLVVLIGMAFGGGAVLALVLGHYWIALALGIVGGLGVVAFFYEWRRLNRFETLFRDYAQPT